MARLHLHPDRLEIALSTAEKTLSLRKDNIVIPRTAIRSATLTDDPWIWVRGIRAPGTAIPLTLAVGQWKFHGGKDFLVLKGTRPSVVIDIADEEFSRVIITTKHGLELVANLQVDVKPAKKEPRARKATPQVTPKPKRVVKVTTDAGAEGAADGSPAAAVVPPTKVSASARAKAPARPKTPAAAKPAKAPAVIKAANPAPAAKPAKPAKPAPVPKPAKAPAAAKPPKAAKPARVVKPTGSAKPKDATKPADSPTGPSTSVQAEQSEQSA